MSSGLSICDIVLCSQITYRLITAAAPERKKAPRTLAEIEAVLFCLSCCLGQLRNVSPVIFLEALIHSMLSIFTNESS
jgi:hypothetical protein